MSRANIMQAVLIGMEPHKAHTFTAWRQGTPEAPAREIGTAYALAEVESLCLVHLSHKDTLLVHEAHAGTGKQVLHAYRVRKGAAKYQRNPVSGLTERVEPLTLDKLFSLPVVRFEPKRAFDAFLDDASGVDRDLIAVQP